MNIIHALILGIVEGITEFLPISSTGHMILVGTLLRIPDTDLAKTFEIVIQLGAIGAVVVLFWKTLLNRRDLWPKILAAFIPTAIIGYLFYKIIKHVLLGNAAITVVALGVGGIIFIMLEYLLKKKTPSTTETSAITYPQAIAIGVAQSFSVIPGVSRSAASIFGGLGMGLSRETSVEFSFLLAVPTMIAATALDLIKSKPLITSSSIGILLVGSFVAFITALVTIKAFLGFVKKHTFLPFGIYRIILAVLFWIFIIR
jgi:undecaprenyl-diphosphatase